MFLLQKRKFFYFLVLNTSIWQLVSAKTMVAIILVFFALTYRVLSVSLRLTKLKENKITIKINYLYKKYKI